MSNVAVRKVTVTDTAELVSGNVRVGSREFINLGSASIFIGGADVEANTDHGREIPAGESFTDTTTNANWYAVVETGTEELQITEAFNG